jgi:hypothetical protein
VEKGEEMDSWEGVMVHSSTGVAEVLQILDFFGETRVDGTGIGGDCFHEEIGNQVEDFGRHVQQRR